MKLPTPEITLATLMWQTIVLLPVVVLNIMGPILVMQYYISIAIILAGEIAGIIIGRRKKLTFAPEIGSAAAQLLFAAAVVGICSYMSALSSASDAPFGENYSGLAVYVSLMFFWLPNAIIAVIVFIVKYISKKERFRNVDYTEEGRIKPLAVWFVVLHAVLLGISAFEDALYLWSAPNIRLTVAVVIINLIFCKRKYIGHILAFAASVGVIIINCMDMQRICRWEPEHAELILFVNISAAAVLGIYNLTAFIIKLVKSRKSASTLDKPD